MSHEHGEGGRRPPVVAHIRGDSIKLDSLLKFTGIAKSGGDAKLKVKSGEVAVNGEICTQRGKKIKPGDKVRVGGEEIVVLEGESGSSKEKG